MALTTTQVNTAFLAALARPAEGSAATWGAGSLNLDSLLNSIFIAENTEDFVESLYTELLGRASDAEGKAFWNSLLATTSKEAVLAQFKAAILAAGQADPSNADYQGLIAQNKAFVQTLYTNLLGREADAEGLDFWANALTSGTSRGDLLAQFTAAAMASGADNDDYQAITAKLAVADAFSAKFSAFNADVTADEKKAALDALKAMMEGVVAGSTVEDVQEEINQIAGNYQNRTSQVFTKANDDDLDASEATAATTFRGTVNLIDAAKGTIQTTDKVSGNTDFDDTLVVNVTSDSTHKLLDLNGDLPTVSDIEKLIVNNGSANVEGDLNDANFGNSVSITGTGDVNLKVNSSLENLSVSSATKGDVAIAVNNTLGNYTGGNAGESVTVDLGGSIKKASLGAGDDTLVIKGAVLAGGAIDLGAGNDDLVINNSITFTDSKDKITLDGGAGSNDTLTLINGVNLIGVKSIKGFETINAQSNAAISSEAANGLKAKLTDGSALTVNASTGTTAINLSGLSVDKNESATVALQGLTQETITLSKTVKENIDISNDAAKNITIKGFVNGSDKLVVAGTASTPITGTKGADLSKAGQVLDLLNKASLSAGTNYVAINTSNGKASYVWKVTKVEGVDLTRDDITLVANVDKALTANDFTGGSQPGPTPPAPGETTGLVYNETYNTLETAQKISGDTVVGVDETAKDKVATAEAIVINAAGANISFDKAALKTGGASIKKVTVQSDANTTNTLDLTNLSTATKGAITTIADTAGNANFTLNETFTNLATINLGAGTDTLTLGADFSGSGSVTVTAGEGDDIVDLIALSNLPTTKLAINGGSGSDTVKLGAFDYAGKVILNDVDTIVGVTASGTTSTINLKDTGIAKESTNAYTLNAIEINGDLVLKADSNTVAIDASALTDTDNNANVTINLAAAQTKAAQLTVTGSASVKETINISGDFSGLASGDKVTDIEAIYGEGNAAKLASTFFTNTGDANINTSVTELNGTLTIDYAATGLDLSKITTGSAKLTLDTVKASGATNETLKLTSAAGIEETVKLATAGVGSGDIIIAGAAKDDIVNITAIATAGFTTNDVSGKGKFTANTQAFYINLDAVKTKTVAEVLATPAAAIKFSDVMVDQSGGGTNYSGAAVVQLKDGIAIYVAKDESALTTDGTLDLIAVVNDTTSAVASLGGNLILA